MNSAVEIAIISGIVTLVAALISVWGARRADRSASATKTLELGVTGLVNELQEERDTYRQAARDCEGRCRELDAAIRGLEDKVEELKRMIIEKDGTIERLRREAGML